MPTVPQRTLGPLDHGRTMTFDEFKAAKGREGYRYELIDGRVYVFPSPAFAEGFVQRWLYDKLSAYKDANPRVINYVCQGGRVFVPGTTATTTPEPDVMAYKNFPHKRPRREVRWQDISPLLVAEVLSENDPGKDLIRNVALYVLVPSIREYWILDAREDADGPTLLVYRRRGKSWQNVIEIGPYETYTTPLLPGFSLPLDTRS